MERWVEVACHVADAIRVSGHMRPIESLTDMSGQFGEPKVYTMWGFDRGERDEPVLREWRYPGPDGGRPDARPCKHEVVAR